MKITTQTTAFDLYVEVIATWNDHCDEASELWGLLAEAFQFGEVDGTENWVVHTEEDIWWHESQMDTIGDWLVTNATQITRPDDLPRHTPAFVRTAVEAAQVW